MATNYEVTTAEEYTNRNGYALDVLGDTIRVTQAGSINIVGSGYGILATGGRAQIAVDGNVTTNEYEAAIRSVGGSIIDISQTGSVSGGFWGISVVGSSTIQNFGTIAATRASGGAISITNSPGETSTLFNSGSIIGSIAIVGGGGSDLVTNIGFIQGDIDLGQGSDVYFGVLGSATGVIDLALGDDKAYGGAGSERFRPGMGNDLVDGGGGIDTIEFTDHTIRIDLRLTGPQNTGQGLDTFINIENVVTHDGQDTLIGNTANNNLNAGGGNDSLDGWTGDDVLGGGFDRDTLAGGDGNDTLDGGYDNDTLNGGAGFDTVVYMDAELNGEGVTVNMANPADAANTYGADTYISIEALVGTRYGDRFIGDGTDTTFTGGLGNDTIDGAAGNDTLVQEQGDGNDVLMGGAGVDTLRFSGTAAATVNLALTSAQNTGYGTDTLSGIEAVSGGSGADTLTGDANANTLTGNAGADRLFGGGGHDLLQGGADADALQGQDGDDTLQGGDGADQLLGGTGNDALFGEAGADTLFGEGGNDALHGGFDADALWGQDGNDSLFGDAGSDTLRGDLGNDVLHGGADADLLHGGVGRDLLTGGAGLDSFVFDTRLNKRTNVDKVLDFVVRDDTVRLENKIFKGLKAGQLAKSAYHQGTKAHDASDRIVYNKKTGALSFDQDGTGSKAAVQFATLSKNLALTNKDFFVI